MDDLGMGTSFRGWSKWILSWIVTIGIVLVLLCRIPLDEVAGTLRGVNPVFLGMAIFLSLLENLWIASEKYRRILGLFGVSLSLRETVILKVGTIPLKNLLPMKSGEIVRMIYLKRRHGLSYYRSGASFLLNALSSVLALSFLFAIGMTLAGSLWMGSGLSILSLGAWAGCFTSRGCGQEAEGTRGGGPERKWRAGLRALLEGRRKRDFWRRMGQIALMAVLLEGMKMVHYGILFQAFHVDVPMGEFLTLTPAAILVSVLPFSVMGIGTREAAVVAFFSSSKGKGALLAAAFGVSFVEGVVPLLAGLVVMKAFFNRLIGLKESGKAFQDRDAALPDGR